MGKYVKAKIKAVQLDCDQSILQVCIIGGAYVNTLETRCYPSGGLMVPACQVDVKGSRMTNCNGPSPDASSPSS